ncbi:MAG: hypothetical protein ABR529_02710 [Actinomycetota bacterium]
MAFGKVFLSLAAEDVADRVGVKIGRPGCWDVDDDNVSVKGRTAIWKPDKQAQLAIVENNSHVEICALVEYESPNVSAAQTAGPAPIAGWARAAALVAGAVFVAAAFLGGARMFTLAKTGTDKLIPASATASTPTPSPVQTETPTPGSTEPAAVDVTTKEDLGLSLIVGGWITTNAALLLGAVIVLGAVRPAVAFASAPTAAPSGQGEQGGSAEGGSSQKAADATQPTPATLVDRRPAEVVTGAAGIVAALAQLLGTDVGTEVAVITAAVGLVPGLISYIKDPRGGFGVTAGATNSG